MPESSRPLWRWIRELTGAVASDLDRRALPAAYAAIAVRTEAYRRHLRADGWAFFDPDAPGPSLADVDLTADRVIEQTRVTAASIGAVAGIGGWAGVPPEVAGWVVAHVRLAQRLAIVYGLDPASMRGKTAIARAIAAGFQVELPRDGLVDVRVSELAALAPTELPRVDVVSRRLARGVLATAVRAAAGRVGRLVPVLASGVAAVDNHHLSRQVGIGMKAVMRQLSLPSIPDEERVVDAHEVASERR